MVCTDALTGKPVYHRCQSGQDADLEWIRASASMPGVSRVVEIENMYLLDGGIVDAIPLKFFESQGYHRNIVVLTRPIDYLKTKSKALPVMKPLLRKYPAVYEAMEERHHVYNRQTAYVRKKEKTGEILVIRPTETLPIGRVEHDPEKLKIVYEIGRTVAGDMLPQIQGFLNKEAL